MPSAKSTMSWQRLNRQQVHIVEVDRHTTIDPAVLGPHRDLSGLRVDQPPVVVNGLVLQRSGDLPKGQPAELEHPAPDRRVTDRSR